MLKFIFRTVIVLSVCFVISLSLILYYVYALSKDLPSLDSLTDYKYDLPTKIYDINNQLVDEYYIKKRVLIKMDQIPPILHDALIAVEDNRFYEHSGIDWIRIVKAFFVNLKNFKIVEGASTITQQTTKLFLLSPERKIERKIKEILLARELEDNFSKKEILELYFNKAYFGRQSYGIEAASQAYFSKSVQYLELDEAALIIGLLKAPSRLSPTRNPDLSIKRRNLVLGLMLRNRFISEEAYREAVKKPLDLQLQKKKKSPGIAYYIEEVRRILVDEFGEEQVNSGGYNIYTAMDLRLQKAAQSALEDGLVELDQRHGYRKLDLNILENNEISSDAFEQIIAYNKNKKILKGVISEVSNNFALVKTDKEHTQIILLNTVSWAREYNLDSLLYKSNSLKSLNDRFKKGDVVLVKTLRSLDASSELDPNMDVLSKLDPSMDVFTKKEQERVKRLWEEEQINFEVTLFQFPTNNGALMALSPETGYVIALTGGYSFDRSQFNRATQSLRQPGSAFKPFIYAAALENSYRASDILQDTPFVYSNLANKFSWIPKNYGGNFSGNVSFRNSLVLSKNIPTIKIVEDIGVKKTISFMENFAFDTEHMPQNLSLALGSHSMTLESMIKGYTTFASGGKQVKPIYIIKITDRNGTIIKENKPEKNLGITPSTAFIMNSILGDVVENGTGKKAKAVQRKTYGKTGTTNNNSDAWYLGFTPNIVAGVYVGNDSPAIPLGYAETGSRAALPIWISFMQEAIKDYKDNSFKQPASVENIRIVKSSGLIACNDDENSYFEFFDENNVPKNCHTNSFETPTNSSSSSSESKSDDETIEF